MISCSEVETNHIFVVSGSSFHEELLELISGMLIEDTREYTLAQVKSVYKTTNNLPSRLMLLLNWNALASEMVQICLSVYCNTF